MYLDVSGPAGRLEALLDEPRSSSPGADSAAPGAAPPRAAVVFAHPHPEEGGTMHTKAVFQGAKGLARIGCSCASLQFPRRRQERRRLRRRQGRGGGFPRRARFHVGALSGRPALGGRLLVRIVDRPRNRCGRSARLAAHRHRAAGHARRLRFREHARKHEAQVLVQGNLDELCPIKDLWAFYAKLPEPKEIVVIDGASHLFEGKTREVGEAIEDLLGDFD